MVDGGGWARAWASVTDAVATARDRLGWLLERDAALREIRASEFPEQRHANDRKQRYAEEAWKMQYDGRPARDPEFRREERLILQKIFENGLNREELANELKPLWKKYHAKFAAEHPPRKETEAERRKKAAMYRKAAGPNIPIPAEYRDVDLRKPTSLLTEGRERLLRLVGKTERERCDATSTKDKGSGRGLGL